MQAPSAVGSVVGIVLAVLLGGVPAAAEPLVVAFYQGGHPPFMFPEGSEETGIYRDILTRVGEVAGLEVEFAYFPFPRAQMMFEEGTVHVEPGINPAWRQDAATPGLYTAPFASSVDVLVFRPGQRIDVDDPGDLAGETVGAIRGYVYPFFSEAFASGTVMRDDATEETGVLEKLVRGRFDQAILSEVIARWWKKRDPGVADYEIGAVVGEAEIMFRVHPSRRADLEKIDAALLAMREAGEIDAIYARYR